MTSDKQVQKVYQAENLILFFFSDQIRYEDDLSFWRVYCKCLLNHPEFKKRYDLRHVHIFELKDENPDKVAIGYKKFNRGFIFLSPNGKYEITVLHEICHLLSDDKDYHWSTYIENMLFLVSLQMGVMMESYLLRAYLYYNVDWEGRKEYVNGENLAMNHSEISCKQMLEDADKWFSAKKDLEKVIDFIVEPYEDYTDMDTKTMEICHILETMTDEVYCPVCGSCGYEDCCDPIKCHSVQEEYKGSFCENNLKTYKDAMKENENLRKQIKEMTNGQSGKINNG